MDASFDRSVGIGASEAAAVLGLSPWARPIDVWTAKVHGETRRDNEYMEWGRRIEPLLLDKLAEVLGEGGVARVEEHQRSVQHPDAPVFATPDGTFSFSCAGDDEEGIVEAKTTGSWDGWGDPWSDGVPDHYLIQGVIQMACCDEPVVLYPVLEVSRRQFRVYRVERDVELEDVVLGRLSAWWEAHVVSKEPPRDDPGSWARAKYRRSSMLVIDAGPAEAHWMEILRDALEERRRLDEIVETAKGQLQAAIGLHEGIEHPALGRVTWKSSKKGARVFRTQGLKKETTHG